MANPVPPAIVPTIAAAARDESAADTGEGSGTARPLRSSARSAVQQSPGRWDTGHGDGESSHSSAEGSDAEGRLYSSHEEEDDDEYTDDGEDGVDSMSTDEE